MPAQAIPKDLVRVHADDGPGRSERLWGKPAGLGRVRMQSVSHYTDLSAGDLVRVVPLCSCDDVRKHFAAAERISRGSRRVQVITTGSTPLPIQRAAEYFATWPTLDGSTCSVSASWWVGCEFDDKGLPLGVCGYWTPDREQGHAFAHWRLAFPLSATDDEVAEFLDGTPGLEFHELMPEGDDE
jgi:hypothetical protein